MAFSTRARISTVVGVLLVVLMVAGTARAESLLVTGKTILYDIKVDSDPRSVALKVPLADFTDLGLGPVRPFGIAGTKNNFGDVYDDALRLLTIERGAASPLVPSSVKLGAGLIWKASDRVEIYGEYRFLSVGRDPVRDADPTSFKAGLTIRLF